MPHIAHTEHDLDHITDIYRTAADAILALQQEPEGATSNGSSMTPAAASGLSQALAKIASIMGDRGAVIDAAEEAHLQAPEAHLGGLYLFRAIQDSVRNGDG